MRNDVHSPKNLVTEDYDFLACGNHSTAEMDAYSPLDRINRALERGYRFGDVHGAHHCSHCGSFLTYYAILQHTPSKTMIHVGETCLDNRFSLATGEFHKLRTEAKLNRERKAAAEKRAEFAAGNTDVVDFLEAQYDAAIQRLGYEPVDEFDAARLPGYMQFLVSLAGQLRRNGHLTEAQIAAVRKSMVRQAEFDAKRAEEKATEIVCDAPEGKVTVSGELKTVKWQDNDFGGCLKMLVKDERGFKVWVTVPRGIDNTLQDAAKAESNVQEFAKKHLIQVQFDATIKPSPDDKAFAFGSRPTKGIVLNITDR